MYLCFWLYSYYSITQEVKAITIKTKLARVYFSDTLWVENLNEIALSRTVKEIEANSCFCIFGQNWKIQNGCHVWGEENFF